MRPQIARALDRSGVAVVPFRVLLHVARCADRDGAATVTLEGTAAVCGLDAAKVQHALRSLSAAGLVRVVWGGERVQVALTGAGRDLVVPPWVDDGGLSSAALRLLYHHVRRARAGRVYSRQERAGDVCRVSLRGVRAAERELIGRAWLEPRGRSQGEHVYVITLPEATVTAPGSVVRDARAG
jgi:hypothetical protein